jgi:hypothetical protein
MISRKHGPVHPSDEILHASREASHDETDQIFHGVLLNRFHILLENPYLSLLQNYKNAVTPAEAGVQKPLTSLDSWFRRNDRKKQV